jgi:hypothetical protein
MCIPNADPSTSYLFFNAHIYGPIIHIYTLHSHDIYYIIYIYIYIIIIVYAYKCVCVCVYVRMGARLIIIYRIRHTSAVAAAKTLSHPHPISRPLKIKGFGRTKCIWKEKFSTTKSIPITILLCVHTCVCNIYVVFKHAFINSVFFFIVWRERWNNRNYRIIVETVVVVVDFARRCNAMQSLLGAFLTFFFKSADVEHTFSLYNYTRFVF